MSRHNGSSSDDGQVLLFLVTEDWYFVSHRLELAIRAKQQGFRTIVATRVRAHADQIRSIGVEVISIDLRREGRSPIGELGAVLELVRLYRRLRPTVVHHVAAKPIMYGTIAAVASGVPRVINAIAGLGSVFTAKEARWRLVQLLVQVAYGAVLRVTRSITIVQNPEDRQFVRQLGVPSERIALVRGSGVDLDAFRHRPEPGGIPIVIVPARLIKDKGIGEFVAAARALRDAGVVARFVLVGGFDSANPSAVSQEQIDVWCQSGVVESWGHRTDMPDIMAGAAVICLPTYREGLPKALLEAAAAGRPIVATDVPGCREIVRPGVNGLLVPARTVEPLVTALRTLIEDPGLRRRMGKAGRSIAEREFSVHDVARATVHLYGAP